MDSDLCTALRTEFRPEVEFCTALGAVLLCLDLRSAPRAELGVGCQRLVAARTGGAQTLVPAFFFQHALVFFSNPGMLPYLRHCLACLRRSHFHPHVRCAYLAEPFPLVPATLSAHS